MLVLGNESKTVADGGLIHFVFHNTCYCNCQRAPFVFFFSENFLELPFINVYPISWSFYELERFLLIEGSSTKVYHPFSRFFLSFFFWGYSCHFLDV